MGSKWDAFKAWLKGEEAPKDHGPTKEWDAFVASLNENAGRKDVDWDGSQDENVSDDDQEAAPVVSADDSAGYPDSSSDQPSEPESEPGSESLFAEDAAWETKPRNVSSVTVYKDDGVEPAVLYKWSAGDSLAVEDGGLMEPDEVYDQEADPEPESEASKAGLPAVKYALSGTWPRFSLPYRTEVRIYDNSGSLEFARRQLGRMQDKRYWRGDITWTEVTI